MYIDLKYEYLKTVHENNFLHEFRISYPLKKSKDAIKP